MDIRNFAENDIEAVISDIFAEKNRFQSMEEAYQQLAQAMCEKFRDKQGKSYLVLSRVYHSMNFLLLPGSLKQVAEKIWSNLLNENSKLITLMGTYGDKPAWCDRTQSKGHKVILLTQETLSQIPMVTQLLQQIGFDLGVLIGKSKGIEVEGILGSFGIFYVSPALGSPYIPAQDFVVESKVECVLGTGVMLPQGDISVYIGFSRVPIEKDIAANIASLMSLFWQRAYPILEEHGMFSYE